MAQRWDVHVIRPEYVAMQMVFEDYLRDTMIREGLHFAIHPYKVGVTTKAKRICDRLQPFVANQQVRFRRDQPQIVEELVNLVIANGSVQGRSPNLVDALTFNTELWRRTPPTIGNDNEIRFIDPEEDEAMMYSHAVRYGLRCPTRSRRLAL